MSIAEEKINFKEIKEKSNCQVKVGKNLAHKNRKSQKIFIWFFLRIYFWDSELEAILNFCQNTKCISW